MSEEDWTIVSKPAVVASKWDEEEDDDVKENWDDDDEDASKASSNADSTAQADAPKAAVSVKKKKQKALKEKLMQKELEMQRPKTQEELLADKLERQRLQEESDLALAKDAFGIDAAESESSSVLSGIQLASRSDFEGFRKALSSKLSPFVRSPHYVPFLEELFRELAVGLEADDIKKLDTVLTTIFNEKIKLQKQMTKGKKGAKKNAQEIRMERDGDYSYNNYDEFDDFL